jgi:hypothetical protein
MRLVASDDPPCGSFDISRQRTDTWAGWEGVSRAAEKAIPAP